MPRPMTAQPQLALDGPAPLPPGDHRNRVMWLNNDRVFYAGLLGQVSQRSLGGWGVYVAVGAPLRLALCGAAAQAGAASPHSDRRSGAPRATYTPQPPRLRWLTWPSRPA